MPETTRLPTAGAVVGDRGWVFPIVGLVVYVMLQTGFYPSYHSFADEGCYVSMAFMFAEGKITGETLTDELNFYRFKEVDGRLVSLHDAGLSMLLVPLTWLGTRALFSFNMLVHVMGFVVFYLFVRRWRLHPAFCLLYLLHPTLWYHSRGIVNDLPSGVFLFVGLYLFLLGTRTALAAGVFWGLSLFVRPMTAVFLVPLLLTWFVIALVKSRTQARVEPEYQSVWKKVLLAGAGGVPLMVLLVLYNVSATGGISGFVPGRSTPGGFSIGNIPLNLLRYGTALNLIYPLMLVLFFFYRGTMRWPLRVAVIAGGTVYLTYVDWGTGAVVQFNLVEDVILGPRYFEALLPIIILSYASVIVRLAQRLKRLFWVPLAVALLLLLGVDAAITVVHQQHMERAAYFRDALFDNTPKGALVCLAWPARTRITGNATAPRKLALVFPFGGDNTPAKLDRELREYGEAYVADLDTGGEVRVSPAAARDRKAFLSRHPHETVVDESKFGWRLKITRVRTGGTSTTPSLGTEGDS